MTGIIACDVSQLVADPVRTGIQRVARAALQHWPGPRPLVPCRYDPTRDLLVPLPAAAIELLRESAQSGLSTDALRREISEALTADPQAPIPLDAIERILVPELFYDAARCSFYARLARRGAPDVRLLAFDFIPWLRPELLDVHRTHPLMPYLSVLRQHAKGVASISAATRNDFLHRILRREQEVGPVLPLGADGLSALPGVERQVFSPDRDVIMVLGSVDGRKNQHLIAAAMRRVRAAGVPLRLTVIGKVFGNAPAREQCEKIAALAAEDPDGIQHHASLTDPELAVLLRQVRATAYGSEVEGFGLPPLESLALGIPAVVSRQLPSVTDAEAAGTVRLDAITEDALAAALTRLAGNAEAERLWRGAATLHPPGWREFGTALGRWVQS